VIEAARSEREGACGGIAVELHELDSGIRVLTLEARFFEDRAVALGHGERSL
jgi:hypothetical protein